MSYFLLTFLNRSASLSEMVSDSLTYSLKWFISNEFFKFWGNVKDEQVAPRDDTEEQRDSWEVFFEYFEWDGNVNDDKKLSNKLAYA